MNAENKPTHLIVGATGSIGSNLARRLADEGARLALAGRDADTLHALAQELGASSHVLDGDPFACVELAAQEAVEQHGSLHGVACCAGSLLLKPAHRTSAEELREVLESNLVTAFASVRAGAQALRKNGGSIVLVSSAAARLGLANHEAIAAAKAGVQGLVLSSAASYARQGIRVNAVAPGLVESKLTEGLLNAPASRQASERMHALGRLGAPGDVAAALAWLLDPQQSWVTGQVIAVDGGLSRVIAR